MRQVQTQWRQHGNAEPYPPVVSATNQAIIAFGIMSSRPRPRRRSCEGDNEVVKCERVMGQVVWKCR